MAKSWIVVADSAEVRIFDADTRTRDLTEIAALIHPESRARDGELASDRPGRAFDSVGGGRHGMSKHVSPHEHEADLFARRIAERLSVGRESGEFEHLQLAAPPAFLGLLRKHLDSKVSNILQKTVTKNLVHENPDAIAVQFFGPGNQ